MTLMVCYSGKLDTCCVFVGRTTRKSSEAYGNETSLTGSEGPLGAVSVHMPHGRAWRGHCWPENGNEREKAV